MLSMAWKNLIENCIPWRAWFLRFSVQAKPLPTFFKIHIDGQVHPYGHLQRLDSRPTFSETLCNTLLMQVNVKSRSLKCPVR